MINQKVFVRNAEAEKLLEIFLVSAITAFLGIRFYLNLTGYPAIGGGGFHIAHMLFGGIMMMLALVIMLTFLGRHAAILSAVLGGLGFGTFIDELGKFVTKDNNYFFEPTIALVYIIFVLMYLAFEMLSRDKKLTHHEYLINTLRLTEEAFHNELDQKEKKKALNLLNKANRKDPIVKIIRELLRKIEAIEPKKPSIFAKARSLVHFIYIVLIRAKLFSEAVVAIFIIYLLASLWQSASIIPGARPLLALSSAGAISSIQMIKNFSKGKNKAGIFYAATFAISAAGFIMLLPRASIPALRVVEFGEIFASILSGIFAISGIYFIRKSRLRAYTMFKFAVLTGIFLTQFFAFYQEQLSAIVGLLLNLAILGVLQYVIEEEENLNKTKNAHKKWTKNK